MTEVLFMMKWEEAQTKGFTRNRIFNDNESPRSIVLKALILVTHKLCPSDGYQYEAGPRNYSSGFRKRKYLKLCEETPEYSIHRCFWH